MAQDIMLDLERMRELHRGLTITVAEFEAAGRTNDRLESAIGNPDGRSALRDKAHDFEGRWNDKREKLLTNLDGIDESLRTIIEQWTAWDADTAGYFEDEGRTTTLTHEP
ncbi:hypothetical protein [Agrococcus carbonis]|uniref:Flagellar protein FlgN n=1 Tax=Agrococcus carbonis TaxID=684552 RepID=A0A1H1QHT1_9MICO|nr:hypothetical protein [Agrococcus carbonis]SDS22863.1 hypothetical protein SAMN04489719_1838 [Agrococcus carbonis]